MSEFQDIRIVGIVEDGISRPDDNMDMFDIPFKLSTVPPQEWATIFADTRPRRWYGRLRRSWLDGTHIVVHARKGDNFEHRREELDSRVAATNDRYREYLAAEAKHQRREQEAQEVRKAQENELKQRLSALDFD